MASQFAVCVRQAIRPKTYGRCSGDYGYHLLPERAEQVQHVICCVSRRFDLARRCRLLTPVAGDAQGLRSVQGAGPATRSTRPHASYAAASKPQSEIMFDIGRKACQYASQQTSVNTWRRTAQGNWHGVDPPQREAEESAFQRLTQSHAEVQVRLEGVGKLGQQVGPLEGYLQARLSWADAGQVSVSVVAEASQERFSKTVALAKTTEVCVITGCARTHDLCRS